MTAAKLGNLYEVKFGFPVWKDRTGYGVPEYLDGAEWVILIGCSPPYDLYGRTIHNVTFLCGLGVRSCYSTHLIGNLQGYLTA